MAETTFKCPRRSEWFGGVPSNYPQSDTYRSDDTCSYCGSLNPDVFMARLESGDVDLGSTDKNYKAYVHNKGGTSFNQKYRDCPSGATCKGPDDCTHWTTREMGQTKFYFQHLSEEQKHRFIELLNAKKITFAGGCGFYVLPFFCVPASQTVKD